MLFFKLPLAWHRDSDTSVFSLMSLPLRCILTDNKELYLVCFLSHPLCLLVGKSTPSAIIENTLLLLVAVLTDFWLFQFSFGFALTHIKGLLIYRERRKWLLPTFPQSIRSSCASRLRSCEVLFRRLHVAFYITSLAVMTWLCTYLKKLQFLLF